MVIILIENGQLSLFLFQGFGNFGCILVDWLGSTSELL